MAQALLALEKILVRYGDCIGLDIPALTVERGECLAVIGPNGAGKSTLLRLTGLLQKPTEGKIYFHNREVIPTDGLEIRRRMASVFQEPLLLNASVYENAVLGLKLRRLDRRAAVPPPARRPFAVQRPRSALHWLRTSDRVPGFHRRL